MSSFDVVIGIIFCIVVFISGVSIVKKGGDSKSFFAAGGAVPWWISGLSLYMSFFSAGTFVVWGAIAYSDGMVAVAIQAAICIAGFIVAYTIAPRWNKTKVITAAEYIEQRLGRRLQKIYTILFLCLSVLTVGGVLYPAGKIIQLSTGFPLSGAIICLGILIVIYTAIGGLWAVLITDVLQFVVLTAAVIIVVPLAFEKVGGVSSFIEQAPENFFALQSSNYTWAFVVALGLYNIVHIGGNWAFVQRFTSVASPKDAKKAGWIFAMLYTISPIVWMLPPMIYRVLQPDLGELGSEGAYLLVSKEVVPAGLLGLILASMVFATASAANTTYNVASSVFTNDIYKYFRKSISNAETMLVARISTLVFGLISFVVALSVPKMGGIIEVVFSIGAITGGAMLLPPVWALFSRRQTAFSALFTTASSLLLNLFFKFVSPWMFDVSLTRAEEMLFGVLWPASVLLTFEIIYFLRGKEDARYHSYEENRLIRERQQPSTSEQAVTSADNLRSRKIIGNAILAVGLIITVLGLVSDNGQILVSTIGFIICAVAVWIILQARAATVLVGDTGGNGCCDYE